MSSESRLRFRRTLAFRLTLWYAGIFTLSSCAVFLLLYMLVASSIRERTDLELLSEANRFSRILATEGVETVKSFAVIEAQAAGVRKVFFRLLSLNGQVFSSSNMSYWKDIGVHAEAIQAVLQGSGGAFKTLSIPGRKEEVRILYSMVGPSLILQIGEALENHSRFLEVLRQIFIVTLSFLLVVSGVVGWFMARRALSGVAAVTETARKISEGALAARVPVKPGGDEIDRLAATFNTMLDRIQLLVAEIREMNDNIAHDLRSPVTRIRGLAEVTLTTAASLGEYEGMAASTIEECDRLLDMINTMLMISKAEAGLDRIAREEFDLAILARKACELFRPTAEDKGLALVCEGLAGAPFVGDMRMVQRMVANLLDNAIKYTPSGGKVRVSVSEADGQKIRLSVEDTGIGIAPEDLSRVFERFYRCDQSRSLPGIGLGLSLARAVARSHGGEITISSTLHKGSTFTVTLPKNQC
jgi:heavy metal sensor kinase